MTPPTPPRPFPRGSDHYELSDGLFPIVLTLFERAPQSATRATPDPAPEPATKRKHRKQETAKRVRRMKEAA